MAKADFDRLNERMNTTRNNDNNNNPINFTAIDDTNECQCHEASRVCVTKGNENLFDDTIEKHLNYKTLSNSFQFFLFTNVLTAYRNL